MAKNQGFGVLPALEQPVQIGNGIREALNRESDILNDDGSAGFTHGANGREKALADRPVTRTFVRICAELNRSQSFKMDQAGADNINLLLQYCSGFCAGFNQQCRGIIGQFAHEVRHAGLVFDRAQAGAIHQLDGGDRCCLEQCDSLACGAYIIEKHQGGGLAGMFGYGFVGDLGNEAQRPLGSNHQVLKNIDRVTKVDQCVERIAGSVLEPIFVFDFLAQGCI